MATFLDSVRERCRVYRGKRDISQAELADLVGGTQSSISNFERGKSLLEAPEFDSLMELLLGSAAGIAGQLRALVDTLENPTIPQEIKEKELKKLIGSFIGAGQLIDN